MKHQSKQVAMKLFDAEIPNAYYPYLYPQIICHVNVSFSSTLTHPSRRSITQTSLPSKP